jgi:hypothetical protein
MSLYSLFHRDLQRPQYPPHQPVSEIKRYTTGGVWSHLRAKEIALGVGYELGNQAKGGHDRADCCTRDCRGRRRFYSNQQWVDRHHVYSAYSHARQSRRRGRDYFAIEDRHSQHLRASNSGATLDVRIAIFARRTADQRLLSAIGAIERSCGAADKQRRQIWPQLFSRNRRFSDDLRKQLFTYRLKTVLDAGKICFRGINSSCQCIEGDWRILAVPPSA